MFINIIQIVVFYKYPVQYDHVRTCFVYGGGVMRAGGQGQVLVYNAESPNHGSKRFNSVTKTIHFAHLDMLFIYASIRNVRR